MTTQQPPSQTFGGGDYREIKTLGQVCWCSLILYHIMLDLFCFEQSAQNMDFFSMAHLGTASLQTCP